MAPQHITAMTGVDLDDTTMFQDLPNWDSYLESNGGTSTGNTVTANIIIAEGNVLLAGGLSRA